jgi:PHD/YefM family antitoxin component YafN of YafNO toxin-antitoxin module
MRTVAIAEAESNLSALLDEVNSEPLAIERDGEKIAFIVSPLDYAKFHSAKVDALLSTLDSIHTEIELKMSRGEFTQDDLDQFARDLDRKAS